MTALVLARGSVACSWELTVLNWVPGAAVCDDVVLGVLQR